MTNIKQINWKFKLGDIVEVKITGWKAMVIQRFKDYDDIKYTVRFTTNLTYTYEEFELEKPAKADIRT